MYNNRQRSLNMDKFKLTYKTENAAKCLFWQPDSKAFICRKIKSKLACTVVSFPLLNLTARVRLRWLQNHFDFLILEIWSRDLVWVWSITIIKEWVNINITVINQDKSFTHPMSTNLLIDQCSVKNLIWSHWHLNLVWRHRWTWRWTAPT